VTRYLLVLVTMMTTGLAACNNSDNIGAQTEGVTEAPSKAQQPPAETAMALPLHLDMNLQIRQSDTDEPEPGSRLISDESDNVLLERIQRVRGGDLDEIRRRHFLRVLVTYSRTNFFFDRGAPKGYEYEQLAAYEKYLNQGVEKYANRVKLIFIPVPFDQLLERLASGQGDIAAAGLTVTSDRQEAVAFTDPYLKGVTEVVVGRPGLGELAGLESLAGRQLVVRRGSSYAQHLESLDRRLQGLGYSGTTIREADSRLATEDILELVNSGAIDLTVADGHIARIWAQVLPALRVYENLKINEGGQISWAVRKDSPKLAGHLNRFIAEHKKGSLLGNILFTRYYKANRWITNPLATADRERLHQIKALFERYGRMYDIDWLKLVAQAYQESQLDQTARSSAGAVGIMQLLPSTAAGHPINIHQIEELENNIHAGAKYMHHLRTTYFDKAVVRAVDQIDFAWAAYNAGPTRIRKLRKIAAERGLDPNRWFGHVEVIAAEKIGRETVDYVRNINKYYVAYKLYFQSQAGSNN